MRKDVENEHSFSRVIDSRDEPVVIAMNVEYRPASDDIRVSEILPHVSRRSPGGPLVIRYQFMSARTSLDRKSVV